MTDHLPAVSPRMMRGREKVCRSSRKCSRKLSTNTVNRKIQLRRDSNRTASNHTAKY